MLSIYKRGEVYHIRGTVSFGGSSRKVRVSTGQTSKRQAEEICRSIEAKVLRELRGEDNLTPFYLAANNWLSIKKGDTDVRNAKLLSKFFFDTPVSYIDTEAWNNLVRLKLRGSEASHINRIRATFKSILNHASVTIEVPRLQEGNDRVRFLDYDTQERLLDTYPKYIYPYFLTLCYQGFRRQEALDIEKQHINLDANTITIVKSKNGKMRIVPIHPRVRAAIEALPPSNHSKIFLNKQGMPYAFGDSLKGIHVRACKKAGVQDFTIHDWRHHWASQLVMVGASIPTLMKLGGWSSERMVLRYAAVSDEHTADTLRRLK